jgi:hypothetical protein
MEKDLVSLIQRHLYSQVVLDDSCSAFAVSHPRESRAN